ncbi:MAG: hypothetical protein LQ342_005603 [Letrouitia transgressa]|nr:MAG: hypothetical protein LQ342_005603 [Letrouitia transgressa]
MRLRKAEEEKNDIERVLQWLLKFVLDSNASGSTCPATHQHCDRETLKSEISGVFEEMTTVLKDFTNVARQQNAQVMTEDLLGDLEESTVKATDETQATVDTGPSQDISKDDDDVFVNQYVARFKESSSPGSNIDGLSSTAYDTSIGTPSGQPRMLKFSSPDSGTCLPAVGSSDSFNTSHCEVAKRSTSWGGHSISETHCPTQLSSILNPIEVRNAIITLPKWKHCQLATTESERDAAIIGHRHAIGPSIKGFSKHGIRFQPTPTKGNLYRTVIVDGLPRNITLSLLLEQVRGGPIFSAELLETFNITGFSSAFIVFVHQHSATRFLRQAQNSPLIFDDTPVKVSLVATPTWPIPESYCRAILDRLQTRCLEVRNFPREVSSKEFVEDLLVCSKIMNRWIEHLWIREGGVLELRFSSIPFAYQVYGFLTSSGKYTMCDVMFTPDPCSCDFNVLPPQTVNTAALSAPSPPQRSDTPETEDDPYRLEKPELADTAGIRRGRGFQTKQSQGWRGATCNIN